MSGKILDCTHDKTTKITMRQYFFPIRLALSVLGGGGLQIGEAVTLDTAIKVDWCNFYCKNLLSSNNSTFKRYTCTCMHYWKQGNILKK